MKQQVARAYAAVERRGIQQGWWQVRRDQLPTALVIGSPKCGTTWLWEVLKAHPAVFTTPRKELRRFDREYERPLRSYYQQWTDGANRVRVEVSPTYSVLPADRIAYLHALIPHARLVLMTRNPIKRDWSATVHFFTRKANPRRIDDVPLAELIAKVNDAGQARYSEYDRLLANWQRYYAPEQILTVAIEDDPRDLLSRVFAHIGAPLVDWSLLPWQTRYNVNAPAPMPPEVQALLAARYGAAYADHTPYLFRW